MKKEFVVIGFMTLLVCVELSGCVNEPKEQTQMAITTFTVEPSTIQQGQTANLSWIVIGAITVSIDQGIGTVGLSGMRIIMPSEDTTYILTASNGIKTSTATAYIHVSGTEWQGTQSTPSVSMTASPVAGTGICSITIATAGQPNISWATAITVSLNCITNGTKMPNPDIVLPATGNIAGGDLIQCKSLTAGSQYSLTLTYRATGGTMGTVTWNQI